MEGILGSINTRVLKEPRGFMKVLQFVFGICAFATTTSFSTSFAFTVSCNKEDPSKVNTTFDEAITYPFQIDNIRPSYVICDDNTGNLYLEGDFSSDSRFFVAVGVLAFLYIIAAVILYTYFSALYDNNDQVPVLDFGAHVLFVILWFAASCAWANSLGGLRYSVSFEKIIKDNHDICGVYVCNKLKDPKFGKLVISVILGFLNVFLWASNLWFLYKETRFYKSKMAETASGTEQPA